MSRVALPEAGAVTMEQMIARAQEKVAGKPLRAAVIAPYYPETLRAIRQGVDGQLILPTLIGDRTKIAAAASEEPLGTIELVPTQSAAEALQAGLRLVCDGEADLLVRGSAPSAEFIRLLLAEGSGFLARTRLAGHVALIEPKRYGKLLAISDAAVQAEPDLRQKIELTQNLVQVCRALGVVCPRVAVLAAVEVVYPQMPVTTEAAVLAKMGDRGQIKGAHIDGPLSFDCAIDPFAAESKGITRSEVAGRADALLAPNMETAHGVYKGMALFGGAKLAGIVYGGRVPVAMPALSDSAETIFHSIALACLVS